MQTRACHTGWQHSRGGVDIADLFSETIVYLSPVSQHFPRDRRGLGPSTTTLWRWRTRGIRGVRLESARLGGRVVTSVEAIRRFMRGITESQGDSAAPGAPSAPRALGKIDRPTA